MPDTRTAYTFTCIKVHESGSHGNYWWEVEDGGDDCGVYVRYREAEHIDETHIACGTAALRAIAAAIIRIADEQDKSNA